MVNPPTLRDVADRARVHPSTASRALNERTRPMVNSATVSRVLKAAKSLGYEPNSLARGLKTNRTFTIGMVIPDLRNPLFPPIVRGIEDELLTAGYTLVLGNSDDDEAKERGIVNVMKARRMDGVILATARREHPLLDELMEAQYPVVLVNRTSDTAEAHAVMGDDHAGIGMAVRHLAGLGHQRIAHVGANPRISTGFTRSQSFVSWVQSEGLELDSGLIAHADWFQEEPGRQAFAHLLEERQDFTGVVAATDLIALGCYDHLKDEGLRVPEDFSIVGYNDIPFSDKFAPPLTTVRIPHYDLGMKAAEILLEVVEGRAATTGSLRLTPELVIRESTGAPRRTE